MRKCVSVKVKILFSRLKKLTAFSYLHLIVMDRISPIKPLAMIVHTIILAVGLAGLYFAYVQFQKVSRFLSTGRLTTATVIALLKEEDEDDGGTLYRPQFEFTDQQNKKVQFQSSTRSSTSWWKVGEVTPVVHDPQNPSEVRIIAYWSLYRYVILLAMFAAPFLVIGLGYFLFIFSIREW